MINFHCTIIPVVVLDSVITHTSTWFLDREIHQLAMSVVTTYFSVVLAIHCYSELSMNKMSDFS